MSNQAKALIKKIKSKQVRVAVVGLGYVGLPLVVEFVKCGFRVLGIDVARDRLKRLERCESYITGITTNLIRKITRSKRFQVTDDFGKLKAIDIIIVCVPTPLKTKYSPDISYIRKAISLIANNFKKGSLVILESTTYPGTTKEVILPLLERFGFRHGKDFYLCFSPERIDPGNKVFPLAKIPKVVGGINAQATELGKLIYSRIIDQVVAVSSSRVAETVKLLENTFRIVNIGLIDELAMMSHKMGIDIWEIIEAAKTKPFGFMPFYPGPGVGGHCIPKDPLYLYWKARKFGFNSRFIKLASETISSMPGYIVWRLGEMIGQKKISSSRAKILVLGVTYKKDIKDLRKSPALDIIELLQKKYSVRYHDPLIPYLKLRKINLESVDLSAKNLKTTDCVIITTDHSKINYNFVLKNAQSIFDTRNVYKNKKNNKIHRL